ncbi:MAG: hypothetical protein JXR96_22195 [Deltaproteobacteria bacterium]|nr:hypothetical protein [Deltaproteobacteria bacterium]
MDTIEDFEDMLALLQKHRARYLIVGGLAFTYHALPRYTKDMDLWIDPRRQNVIRANRALADFGSLDVLNLEDADEILQIGVAPNRIDLIRRIAGVRFETAWKRRIRSRYGSATAYWIDLDSLIRIKARIDHPRHQEDARILREVRRRRASRRRKA